MAARSVLPSRIAGATSHSKLRPRPSSLAPTYPPPSLRPLFHRTASRSSLPLTKPCAAASSNLPGRGTTTSSTSGRLGAVTAPSTSGLLGVVIPTSGRMGGARSFPAAAAASASYATGDAAYAPGPAAPVWDPPASTFMDKFRAIAFYSTSMLIAIPLFLVMLLIQPLVLLFDKLARRAQHIINDFWANTSTAIFYKTEVVGKENLPPANAAAVYVVNHQSNLDIQTLFQLRRPFKFISKTSNFLIPVVGWSMFLTGHVGLLRTDKRSQMDCLKQCLSLLQNGVPVLFFPEGTRTKDGKMHAFKKGAFSIAAKAGVPVVPVTLLGTGTLMPNGKEGTIYSKEALVKAFGVDRVRVVVHPPIVSSDADELCTKAREAIARTLRENGMGVVDGPQ